MKFFGVLSTALLATGACARSSYFGGGSNAGTFDDALKVPGENPLQHCKDPSDDILLLESVDLNPNPPLPGNTLTVTAKGNLSQPIEDGATVKLQVKYGLITIIRQTADLCDTVKNVDLECPLDEGETKLSKDVDLPKQIPPGKYTVTADVYTKDEEEVTCLQATVEFKRQSGQTIVQFHEDV